MKYPVFFKYKERLTYFKFLNSGEFKEIRILGNFFNVSNFKATTLPDRNFMADILEDKGLRMETITEYEFEDVLENCYRTKIEKNF